MSKTDILRAMDYLGHIVEAIDRIHRYVDDLIELGFLENDSRRFARLAGSDCSPDGHDRRNTRRARRAMRSPSLSGQSVACQI